MHRILFLPDIRLKQKPDTGYPVKAGYRIFALANIFLVKYKLIFLKLLQL
jgi:hypothetical protein